MSDFDPREFIFREYQIAYNTPTDINQHLPLLQMYANKGNHITEFGVRNGQSTRAWLDSNVTVRSYDLYEDPVVRHLFNVASSFKDAQYIIGNSLEVDIEPTDMLFIDTDHRYSQLKAELERHHEKVSTYIAFHDTLTYGCQCQDGKGLLAAILEFMADHQEWGVEYHTTDNNGLTIIRKFN